MKKLIFPILILLIAMIVLTACAGTSSTTPVPTSAGATSGTTSGTTSGATADGKTLLESRCVSCHSLAKVVNQHGDASQWQQVVTQMVNNGAQLNADEQQVLVQYLAANFK